MSAAEPVDAATSVSPEPRRRGLSWLWIVIGAVIVVAVVVAVVVLVFLRPDRGPIDATDAILKQVQLERYDRAYALSCAADRDRYTLEQYERVFTTAAAARGKVRGYDVDYSSIDGDAAEVRYDITFDKGGTERYEATAHKEAGKWRACLFPVGEKGPDGSQSS